MTATNSDFATDRELTLMREQASCAALLERTFGWRLDLGESTKRALKYRRGAGEVLIVNHDGRGWFHPHSDAQGDVFDLVRFLDPGINFGHVRKVLRPIIGIAPTLTGGLRGRSGASIEPERPVWRRWAARPHVTRDSPTWRYLTRERRLPASVLVAAGRAGVLREGPHGSGWFAHRDEQGTVSHVDIRGPDYRGSLLGGHKTLFRLPGYDAHDQGDRTRGGAAGVKADRLEDDPRRTGPTAASTDGTRRGRPTRLVVAEAPIDALSVAAIEGIRADTIYFATGGGMGPGTIHAVEELLRGLTGVPGAVLVSATDANLPGERYAHRHRELAAVAAVGFERLTPTTGIDWNDVLKRQGRGA